MPPLSPPQRLKVENLSCSFAQKEVVSNVTFSVASGQVVCLLGPSGCGKTTILRIIAGVEDALSGGRVEIDGVTVAGEGAYVLPEKRSVGLMFQDFALFPYLTVAQNIAFGLKQNNKEKESRVHELLARVNLVHYGDKYPHQLSGGEQQRVALARALAPRPKVMLMDEPFSGLDNRLRDGIRDKTLDILRQEGAAIVLVTHEPGEAMRVADEIVLMRDGGVVQKGAPYNVYNAPIDKEAASFFSNTNVIKGVCKGSLTQTPFGAFLTPGHADKTAVDIVIRPQHLKIDFDRGGRGPNPTINDGAAARGKVQRARFLGHESLVEFAMDHDGSTLVASVPGVFLPKEGTALWLMIRRDKCFVFPNEK